MGVGAFILTALLFAPSVQAEFRVPTLDGPVVDRAGLVDANDERELERILKQAHSRGTAQIQVVTVPSLEGLTVEEAAIKIFDQWKLGGEKSDNGVLFLVANQERRMRIEVGRGLEGAIPDVIAKRILADQVTPLFRAGRPSAGIVVGVSEILRHAQGEAGGEALPSFSKSTNDRWIFLGIFLVFVIVQILRVMAGGGVRPRGRRRVSPWIAGGIAGGYGGWSSGGGWGGGGGWSGGGGSSAGGGASGGW